MAHVEAVRAEFQAAKDTADMANQGKSALLASMNHASHTPMPAIIGMADLLWETPLMQGQQDYVRLFKTPEDRLLTLINDILDLSQVKVGPLELEQIAFGLGDLVEQTAELLAVQAYANGLELSGGNASLPTI